jgi:hypothetical protein
MRDAAAAILALSLSRPAPTRFSRARRSFELGGAPGVAPQPLGRHGHDEAPPVVGDLAHRRARGGARHPVGVGTGGGGQHGGDVGVTVQPGGQDVAEALVGQRLHVVGRDQAPIRHHGDGPDAEAPLEVVEDAGEGGHVGGVAGEDVVGDGDAVAGDEQADDDLGPVAAVVTGVAEGPGLEAPRGLGRPLEVGGGQVVADQAQVQVGEVGQGAVEVGLGRFLGLGHHVEGPVVVMRRRLPEAGGHDHVGAHPLGQGPLGARGAQPVGHHGEDSVGDGGVMSAGHGREVAVQSQPCPIGRHRGHRPGGAGLLGLDARPLAPRSLAVGGQRGHDAVELAAGPQRGCLAQAGNDVVAHPGAVSHGLHQAQVLIDPVTPTHSRRLHVHASNCNGCRD